MTTFRPSFFRYYEGLRGACSFYAYLDLPFHSGFRIEMRSFFAKDSVILLEQIRTLDKRRLREKMGHLDEEIMQKVNTAISVSFGLDNTPAANTPPRVYARTGDGMTE